MTRTRDIGALVLAGMVLGLLIAGATWARAGAGEAVPDLDSIQREMSVRK
jgi:hypothetical protein